MIVKMTIYVHILPLALLSMPSILYIVVVSNFFVLSNPVPMPPKRVYSSVI